MPAAGPCSLGSSTATPTWRTRKARSPAAAASLDPVLVTYDTATRLRQTLEAGITTARDLGGLSTGFRTAVETGRVVGPRLHTAVRIISHTGGHADFPSARRHRPQRRRDGRARRHRGRVPPRCAQDAARGRRPDQDLRHRGHGEPL